MERELKEKKGFVASCMTIQGTWSTIWSEGMAQHAAKRGNQFGMSYELGWKKLQRGLLEEKLRNNNELRVEKRWFLVLRLYYIILDRGG